MSLADFKTKKKLDDIKWEQEIFCMNEFNSTSKFEYTFKNIHHIFLNFLC